MKRTTRTIILALLALAAIAAAPKAPVRHSLTAAADKPTCGLCHG